MPPIRKISTESNKLVFTDFKGIEQSFDALSVPMGVLTDKDPVAKLEDYLNNTWIPSVINGYQMVVHVISVSPLSLTVCAANLGVTIPPNWWI